MVLDDPIDDRESQTRTNTHALGGEARVEDALELIVRNAVAGVGEAHHGSIVLGKGLDADLPFPLDGLNRVHHEVHEDLIELLRVRHHRGQIAVALRDLHTLSELVSNEGQGVVETLVQVRLLPLRFVQAREAPQTVDGMNDALGGRLVDVDEPREILDRGGENFLILVAEPLP